MDYIDKINECDNYRKLGLQSKVNPLLREFLKNRYEIVFTLHDAEIANKFTLCLFQILQLDMCEDEEEEIDVCKLAYFNVSNLIQACEDDSIKIESYRLRALLLSHFGELLIDSLVKIFYSERRYSTEEYMAQRSICDDYINKMQLSDIYTIDDITEGTYNDGLLGDISNSLDEETVHTPDEIEKAALMHNVLYAYIKTGYKK